jgi:polar amino acid transport system substrate-binding protein
VIQQRDADRRSHGEASINEAPYESNFQPRRKLPPIQAIALALDGAPDKFLTGAVRSATIVRLPGQVSDAVEALRDGKADAYGSNGEFVYAIAAKLPGAKIVPGAFTTVHMAVLVPKGRSVAAVDRLSEIVKAAIATGIPQQAIERQQLKGVRPTSG